MADKQTKMQSTQFGLGSILLVIGLVTWRANIAADNHKFTTAIGVAMMVIGLTFFLKATGAIDWAINKITGKK